MRVGAGDELPGEYESLLGKIEMEDPVSRRRVVRLLDAMEFSELSTDRRLPVVGLPAGKNKMVVGVPLSEKVI